MFRKRKRVLLKEESPSCYKLFMKYARYICLVLALSMFVTSINWNVFFAKAESIDVMNEGSVENYLDQSTDPYSIPIQFEDISKRDAYTKYFRKLDGSYEVSVYEEAVHYFNGTEWIEIDNSLKYDKNLNEYENKNNTYNFKLPKKIHDNKTFKLGFNDYRIDWTIKNINQSEITVIEGVENKSNNLRLVENVNQSVIYNDIQPNVNLEYILKGTEIKENIILEKYIENYQFTYHFKLKNLELQEIDGEIVFVDEFDEVIFSFGSLYMFDANFNVSTDIDINITKLRMKNMN